MKKFEELDKRDAKYVNQDILKKWKSEDILAKTIQNRENNKTWVFYDGPIYANAKPGIHHVLAKTIKDSFCKYKTMQGYKVLRKIGLDTHGLPIEVNVEKKLGFKTKADIEKFGIENFCKECNKATALNIDEINDVTDLMGQFIDCENPYITCSNNFIESECGEFDVLVSCSLIGSTLVNLNLKDESSLFEDGYVETNNLLGFR